MADRKSVIRRLISGWTAIGLFLLVCFGPEPLFVLAAATVATFALVEWIAAYQQALPQERRFGKMLNRVVACTGIVLPVVAAFSRFGLPHFASHLPLVTVAPLALFALLLVRAARTHVVLGALQRWWGLIGLAYIGLPLSAFVLLHANGPHQFATYFGVGSRGAWLLLDVASCVWVNDTTAFFIGRAVGKRKLAPSLSPNKTVEGAVAGLVGALLFGIGFGFGIHLAPADSLALALIAGLFGPVGDLFESALKRELGIKDFGALIPGHGGALDRLDSLLFVVPVAYLYLTLIRP